MKGLLSAYSCLPNTGSENGLGWDTALSAAKVLDKVYVVTKKSNEEKIEQWKRNHTCELKNIEFVYVIIPNGIKKLPGHLGQIIRYEYFQRKLIPLAKSVVEREKVDYCQHVTWASFIRKNYLYQLRVPVILGPVGGGEMIPKPIDCQFTLKERLLEWVRYNAARRVAVSKVHHQMFEQASLILTTTSESKVTIPEQYRYKIEVQQAIGIDSRNYTAPENMKGNNFIVLMSGRMLYWKGFDVGLKAFLKFAENYPDAELHIFGDGNKRKQLEAIIKDRNGINVTFHGNVSHNEMLSYYRIGTLFLNCSYHDSGSFVVLEAMANGLPIITIQTGGPAVLTDESCAVRIKPTSECEMIEAIKNALEKLYLDRRLCIKMGKKAYERAISRFDYDKKYEILAAKIEKQLRGVRK